MVIIFPCLEQLLEHVLDAGLELVGQVLDRHALGQRDVLGDGRRRGRRQRARAVCSGRAVWRRPPPDRGGGRTPAAGLSGPRPPARHAGTAGIPGRAARLPGCCGRTGCDGQRARAAKRLRRDTTDADQRRRRGPRRQHTRPRRRHRRRAGPRRRSHDSAACRAWRPRALARRGCGGGGGCGGGTRRHRRVGFFDAQPQRWRRRRGPAAGGRRRSAAESPGALRRSRRPAGRGDRSGCAGSDVDGRRFGDGNSTSSSVPGRAHVRDGHLFDRLVVDLDVRVRLVNVDGSSRPRRRRPRGWRRRARPGGSPWRP